ncbi:hypothetical protein SAMN05661080_03596 [Modestobacter sp. DSM 44400]|uniref:hypothetical protein n=1 Tax=Modestobacter sp. DSM 44400 TaxID=1550230 RepID=UPI000898FC32|nr:hypothetical protein [Modestobacter sp. DSM 44400]SDY47779.1 hypothetical protein SAMN05661080_03596 [Modestobacter sp. DSM 44400]
MRITIQIDRTTRGHAAGAPAATSEAPTGEAPALDAGPAPSESLASLAGAAEQHLDDVRSAGPAPTSGDDERGGT